MPPHPDFICIGAQKAATTWLYQSLKARPDIFLPVIKELHYFSQLHADKFIDYAPRHRKSQTSEAIQHYQRTSSKFSRAIARFRPSKNRPYQHPEQTDRSTTTDQTIPPSHSPRVFGPSHRKSQIGDCLNYFQRVVNNIPAIQHASKLKQLDHIDTQDINDEWYRAIFSFAEPTQIRAEICPCYMPLPEDGIRHILSINKKVRVLLIVRDPIDRIWSHLRMHISFNDPDFDTNRIYDGSFNIAPYLQYTDYEQAIARWESIMPRKAFRVMLYDDIMDTPTQALNEILDFMGTQSPSDESTSTDPVFVGEQIELPPKLREHFLEILAPQYDFLKDRFPKTTHKWIQQHENALCTQAIS